eukprot:403343804
MGVIINDNDLSQNLRENENDTSSRINQNVNESFNQLIEKDGMRQKKFGKSKDRYNQHTTNKNESTGIKSSNQNQDISSSELSKSQQSLRNLRGSQKLDALDNDITQKQGEYLPPIKSSQNNQNQDQYLQALNEYENNITLLLRKRMKRKKKLTKQNIQKQSAQPSYKQFHEDKKKFQVFQDESKHNDNCASDQQNMNNPLESYCNMRAKKSD